jgi:hypothetical protein
MVRTEATPPTEDVDTPISIDEGAVHLSPGWFHIRVFVWHTHTTHPRYRFPYIPTPTGLDVAPLWVGLQSPPH